MTEAGVELNDVTDSWFCLCDSLRVFDGEIGQMLKAVEAAHENVLCNADGDIDEHELQDTRIAGCEN